MTRSCGGPDAEKKWPPRFAIRFSKSELDFHDAVSLFRGEAKIAHPSSAKLIGKMDPQPEEGCRQLGTSRIRAKEPTISVCENSEDCHQKVQRRRSRRERNGGRR